MKTKKNNSCSWREFRELNEKPIEKWETVRLFTIGKITAYWVGSYQRVDITKTDGFGIIAGVNYFEKETQFTVDAQSMKELRLLTKLLIRADTIVKREGLRT